METNDTIEKPPLFTNTLAFLVEGEARSRRGCAALPEAKSIFHRLQKPASFCGAHEVRIYTPHPHSPLNIRHTFVFDMPTSVDMAE